MQNAVVKEPISLRRVLPFTMLERTATTPGCRPAGPACNQMCAGLHQHEHAACVWRSVRAGQSLYQQGEALCSIFAVRSGTFKSTLTLVEGSTRVCAFPMAGDVIALDGLGRATYATTMTALDDAHVCAIARTSCDQSTGLGTDVQGRLGRLMCDEMVRAQKVLVLMGTSRAQDRMGVFLMDISRRYLAQGYSGRDFTLRMTRSDIGSFLGMALETVSRCLTGMQAQGVIEITNRRIQITNLETFSKRYGAWL